MANILITGVTGFIGSHLCDYLSNNPDNKIYGLYRSVKHESTYMALKLPKKKNINLVLGNINDFHTISEIVSDYDIDQIYHLAAQSIVKNANLSPVPTYLTNMFGTINILEVTRISSMMHDKDIPTLVMSSDKAYGSSKILPYTENLPLNGLDIYSASKACEDILARSYAYNYNLPIVVCRSANVFGSYDFNWSRIIPQFIKAYLNNERITIFTNTSKQIREYIHVSDVVKALSMLINEDNIKNTKNEAFNITSGLAYNVEQILDIFTDVTCYDNIIYDNKDKGFKEIEKQTLDNSKIKNMIDWKPSVEIDTKIMKTMINDYKNWFDSNNIIIK